MAYTYLAYLIHDWSLGFAANGFFVWENVFFKGPSIKPRFVFMDEAAIFIELFFLFI